MNPILDAALEAICRERGEGDSSDTFEAVEALHQAYGEEDLANRLFAEIPRTVPFEIVVELFDILAWETRDNGAAMTRTMEGWLREGKDNRKLLIALHLEVYPFIDAQEMYAVLSKLEKTAIPRVRERCGELIRLRRENEKRYGSEV